VLGRPRPFMLKVGTVIYRADSHAAGLRKFSRWSSTSPAAFQHTRMWHSRWRENFTWPGWNGHARLSDHHARAGLHRHQSRAIPTAAAPARRRPSRSTAPMCRPHRKRRKRWSVLASVRARASYRQKASRAEPAGESAPAAEPGCGSCEEGQEGLES